MVKLLFWGMLFTLPTLLGQAQLPKPQDSCPSKFRALENGAVAERTRQRPTQPALFDAFAQRQLPALLGERDSNELRAVFDKNRDLARKVWSYIRREDVPSKEELVARLSPNEKNILLRYMSTHEGYDWNEIMRTGKTSPEGLALQSALGKLNPYHGLTFRVVKANEDLIRGGLLKEGAIISDKGFFSTSRASLIYRDKVEDLKADYIKLVVLGKSGRSVEALSGFKSAEQEVLFAPRTSFRVLKVLEKSDSSKVVFIEESP